MIFFIVICREDKYMILKKCLWCKKLKNVNDYIRKTAMWCKECTAKERKGRTPQGDRYFQKMVNWSKGYMR
jgi:hypothetical protein